MEWEKLLPELVANSPWVIVLVISARWFAEHVAKPLVKGHTSFLDATLKQMERTDKWLESNSESLRSLAEQSATQTQLMQKLSDQRPRRTGK